MTALAAIASIRTALLGYVFRVRSEAELQRQVVEALNAKIPGCHVDTEVHDASGRFDVRVRISGVVVVLELKIRCSAASVERQAQRYAMTYGVDAVMVVTTSRRLESLLRVRGEQETGAVPRGVMTLGGKPFSVLALRTT